MKKSFAQYIKKIRASKYVGVLVNNVSHPQERKTWVWWFWNSGHQRHPTSVPTTSEKEETLREPRFTPSRHPSWTELQLPWQMKSKGRKHDKTRKWGMTYETRHALPPQQLWVCDGVGDTRTGQLAGEIKALACQPAIHHCHLPLPVASLTVFLQLNREPP